MFDQPAIFSYLLSVGMELIFYVVVLIFTIYTLFLAYHWYAYGTHRATATLALAIYLIGSVPMFLTLALFL